MTLGLAPKQGDLLHTTVGYCEDRVGADSILIWSALSGQRLLRDSRCDFLFLVVFGGDFVGCSVAESGVKSDPIVEHLDVLGNSPAGTFSGRECGTVDQLVLQGSKERFGHSIIPTNTSTSH